MFLRSTVLFLLIENAFVRAQNLELYENCEYLSRYCVCAGLSKLHTMYLTSNVFAKESVLSIPNVDHIFGSLSNQKWDADEVLCRDRLFTILENVKNSTLWATWVWNSIDQSPTGTFFGARYHLGNYDQCLRPPWLSTNPELRTQYCLAEIEMNKDNERIMEPEVDPYSKAEDYYLHAKSPFGRIYSYFAHGVCLPAGCPRKSVEKFVKALLNTGYLHAARDAPVSITHCEEAGAKTEYSRGYFVYMYTFAALLFIAVGSTYYISEYPVTASSNSFVNHVAKSFCFRRNWNTVFKAEKDELMCLHGIRFMTSTIIVYIHYLAIQQGLSVSNANDFELMSINKPLLAMFMIHFDVFVDTFFAMSALLFGKSLSTMDITKPYSLIKNILKRYIRLIVPFAVTVLYLTHVSKYTDDGPVYPKIALREQQACEKTWWLALLMVGNYFSTSDMCHPATWYIPCDFHFHVITLVLLYMYRKNAKVGKVATAIILLIGFLGPAISTFIYDLPAVLVYDMGAEVDIRNSPGFNFGYIRTHNRMGPYVVGLLVGYVMSLYKPKDYRKIWSKTVSFLGAYAFLNLMLVVLVLGMLAYTHKVTGLLACVFTTFDRSVFAIAVLGVIIFCTYGDVPLINPLLSWPVFAPLSRLSYGVYVIHLLFLYQSASVRTHLKQNLFENLINALGLAVVSVVLSLIVWLLAEAPLVNITSRYLNTKSPAKEKVHPYEETPSNGVHQNGTNKAKTN